MKWIPDEYMKTCVKSILKAGNTGLFLDPGLRKTSIVLSAITTLSRRKGVLIIAPIAVCDNTWPSEIKKWNQFQHLTYTMLRGADKNKNLWLDRDIYLINPEGIKWLYKALSTDNIERKRPKFNVLVVDESSKFKNPLSKTFKLLKDMLVLFNKTIIMTGTPCTKSLLDLWSQIYILDGGKALGKNFYQFRNKNFYWDKYSYHLKDNGEKRITESIAHLVINMSKDDYLDLPDILYNDIAVKLDDKALQLYKTMEHELFLKLDDSEVSADQTVQAIGKCHQIANGAVYADLPEGVKPYKGRPYSVIHNFKLEALGNLIDELNYEPIIVVYNYKHDFIRINEYLESNKNFSKHAIQHLGSGLKPKVVSEIIENWNNRKIDILLVHPAVMSHGLNMQYGGNNICWFSLMWDLERYLQLNDRIHRSGLKDNLMVHHLLCGNTLDYAIKERLLQRDLSQKTARQLIQQYRTNLNETT